MFSQQVFQFENNSKMTRKLSKKPNSKSFEKIIFYNTEKNLLVDDLKKFYIREYLYFYHFINSNFIIFKLFESVDKLPKNFSTYTDQFERACLLETKSESTPMKKKRLEHVLLFKMQIFMSKKTCFTNFF